MPLETQVTPIGDNAILIRAFKDGELHGTLRLDLEKDSNDKDILATSSMWSNKEKSGIP